MTEHNALPKSARDQLARDQRALAGVHPDTDLLAAFSEGALGESERTRVMEHVSRCSECREVVFLAAPLSDQQPARVEVPQPSPRKERGARIWKLMPVISAVAAVVVVGSAVLLNRQHVDDAVMKRAEVEVQEKLEARTSSPPAQNAVPGKEVTKRDAQPTDALERTAESRGEAGGVIGGIIAEKKLAKSKEAESVITANVQNQQMMAPGPHGLVAPKGSVSNYQRVAVTPPPPVVGGLIRENDANGKQRYFATQAPGSQNEVVVSGAAPEVPVQQADAKDKTVASNTISAIPMQGRNVAEFSRVVPATAERAKAEVNKPAAPASTTQSVEVTATGYADSAARLDSLALRAQWRITGDGILQRSFGDEQWTPVLAQAKAKLRVVAVIGNEVWAGGDGGMLFHSADSGAHWSRVKLHDRGQAVKDSITAIRFRDARNGELVLADGSIWQTPDGGGHWSRR